MPPKSRIKGLDGSGIIRFIFDVNIALSTGIFLFTNTKSIGDANGRKR